MTSAVTLGYESIEFSPFVTDHPVPLARQIAAAAGAGFPWMSFDIWSLRRHAEGGGTVAELGDALHAHGIRCAELQALSISPDERATLAQAEELAAYADVFKPAVLMLGFTAETGDREIRHLRRAAAILTQACPSLCLGLEFLPTFSVCDITSARNVVHRANIERLGLVVDTWHFFQGPSDWPDLEKLPREELSFVQFNDHAALVSDNFMFETIQRRVLPGQGVFDLARFVRTVLEKGYEGLVGVEIISAPLRELGPEEFARQAYRSAAAYWKQP